MVSISAISAPIGAHAIRCESVPIAGSSSHLLVPRVYANALQQELVYNTATVQLNLYFPAVSIRSCYAASLAMHARHS